MQIERRRDGEIFVLEAFSWEAEYLEPIRQQWPRSYIQWERDGVPVQQESGDIVSSGPSFALWRPLNGEPTRSLELDDPSAWPTMPSTDRTSAELLMPLVAPAPVETPSSVVERPKRSRGGRPVREMKSTRHKSITRVDRDEKKLYGYHVRILWQGEAHQKWFSDDLHGGRLGALTDAIKWRDSKERALGKPRSERMIVTSSRSTTGHVGVARMVSKGHEYYRALWRDAEGRMHRRFFNIKQLGERRALKAAIKARAEGEAQRLR